MGIIGYEYGYLTMINISHIKITPEVLSLITEIDEFKGAWKLFSQLTPEKLNSLKKVATIESIGSSTRIEGSKLSDKEVGTLLSRIKKRSFQSRDEQEVAGYAYVCDEIFSSYEAIPFTENVIKQLHGWLLKYSKKDDRHRGEYKKFPNHVEAFDSNGKSIGIVFETSTPFKTPREMEELVNWTRKSFEEKSIHPLLAIGIFIVVFLSIHPFQDGNGRLSRILTTLLLLKYGYAYVMYSSLESIIEGNKENYYLALRRTQQSLKKSKPDFNTWLLFFLRSLQKQKRLLEEKIVKEKELSLYLPELSGEILKLINRHGRLTIRELVSMTKANRNTIKKHIALLARSKKIKQNGKGRGTWYTRG